MDTISIPLYQRLYEDIKEKIQKSEYKRNEKLESVRALSNRLNISTTTVEKAYNQLLVEGYIHSKPRSGYYVVDIRDLDTKKYTPLVQPIKHKDHINSALTQDLFDIKSFKTVLNQVINYDTKELYKQCDPRGEHSLREEIRKYVLQERNVECDVNQIIVGPGIQSLLHILLHITKKSSVTYLTPEFQKAMDIFRDYNYKLKARNTIKEIIRLKSDFLYISPSNIYPTGEVLKVQDRNRIIRWAHQQGTYIIEDDYNFFIRYNSYTVPSIHSYDNGENVIYMGSFSKTILPSLRISFMILPVSLYKKYKPLYKDYSQGVSKLDQLALARFMKEKLFSRHTKKLYKLYKEKNQAVIETLESLQGHHKFDFRGTDSNLHIILDFSTASQCRTFCRNCDRYDLEYHMIKNSNSVIFPYSGIEQKTIKKLIKDLFYNI